MLGIWTLIPLLAWQVLSLLSHLISVFFFMTEILLLYSPKATAKIEVKKKKKLFTDSANFILVSFKKKSRDSSNRPPASVCGWKVLGILWTPIAGS